MKKTNIFLSLLLMFGMTSCSDFLEEYSQDTAYVHSLTDLDELLLGSAYMPIHSYSSYANSAWNQDEAWFYPYINVMSDEVKENIQGSGSGDIWGHPNTFFGYFTWQKFPGMNPEGTQLGKEDNDWNRIYKCINVSNMILSEVAKLDVNESQKKQADRIAGEAHFLRGAYFFTLLNLYAKPYSPATASTDPGVSIKLTEYIEDNIYERQTVAECYAQVVADLSEAERLLSGREHVSNYRADINAVNLLQSRVALYMQNYADASAYAKKVIERKPVIQDLNTMKTTYFLDKSLPEVIFSMGNGGLSWTINGQVTAYGVSDELYNSYTDNDLRKTLYVNRAETGNYAYVKSGENADISRSSLSANFLLRTSEAYLNLAEAEALQGHDAEAQKAVNTLRKARFVTGENSALSMTGNALVAEIRNERMRELCLEGHRWFDLRRYMVNDKVPYSKTIEHTYTQFEYTLSYVSWSYEYVPIKSNVYVLKPNDAGYTLSIPHEVIEFNLGMKDNDLPVRNADKVINY